MSETGMPHAIVRNALILGLFAVFTAGVLALTNARTAERIECNRQAALARSLLEVMPADSSDNNLLQDVILVRDPALGRGDKHLYRARQQGQPSGLVLEATAPDGYGGAIDLLVGITVNGDITGVRVVPPHNETPGLGDAIDIKKSDWIRSFNGLSLANTPATQWAVTKDGGQFDAFTGATITPRAVVAAVYRALTYYAREGDTVFDAPSHIEHNTGDCDG